MSVFGDTVFVLLMGLGLFAAVIPGLAKFGYDGVWKGVTLTHFRMRRGWIARVYGVFYLAFLLVILALVPGLISEMLTWNRSAVLAALGERFSLAPEAAWIFVGLGVVGLIAFHWAIQSRVKRDPEFANDPVRQRHAKLYLFPNGILMIALGVYSLVGAPFAIVLLTLWPSLFVALWPEHAAAWLAACRRE